MLDRTHAADVAGDGPLTVLVVDDSKLQRRLLTATLKREGYRVLEAAAAPEALEICDRIPVDVLITDWMMPGLTGPELIATWRARLTGRYGYALLLTSKSGIDDIAHGLDHGADEFLTKPVNGQELRARLRAGERVVRMERELWRKNDLLGQTLAEARDLHAAIERDLIEARKLQQSLLPFRTRQFGAATVSLLLQPSGHVGGDLVGVVQSDGDELAIFAIDVSGHGITSALMTARLAGYLGGVAPEQNIALARVGNALRLRPPVEVAERLNNRMLRDLDSELYCTFAMARIDQSTGVTQIVQAGHPHPIVLRQGGTIERVGQGGLPVGLFEDPGFGETETVLAPGDRLLLLSDGVTELMGADGHHLSETAIDAVLSRHVIHSATGFFDTLLWDLEHAAGAAGFEDDVSGVLLDYRRAAT